MVAEIFESIVGRCGSIQDIEVCGVNRSFDYYTNSIDGQSGIPCDFIALLILSSLLLQFFLIVVIEIAVCLCCHFYILWLWVVGVLELFGSGWIDEFPNA